MNAQRSQDFTIGRVLGVLLCKSFLLRYLLALVVAESYSVGTLFFTALLLKMMWAELHLNDRAILYLFEFVVAYFTGFVGVWVGSFVFLRPSRLLGAIALTISGLLFSVQFCYWGSPRLLGDAGPNLNLFWLSALGLGGATVALGYWWLAKRRAGAG